MAKVIAVRFEGFITTGHDIGLGIWGEPNVENIRKVNSAVAAGDTVVIFSSFLSAPGVIPRFITRLRENGVHYTDVHYEIGFPPAEEIWHAS